MALTFATLTYCSSTISFQASHPPYFEPTASVKLGWDAHNKNQSMDNRYIGIYRISRKLQNKVISTLETCPFLSMDSSVSPTEHPIFTMQKLLNFIFIQLLGRKKAFKFSDFRFHFRNSVSRVIQPLAIECRLQVIQSLCHEFYPSGFRSGRTFSHETFKSTNYIRYIPHSRKVEFLPLFQGCRFLVKLPSVKPQLRPSAVFQ